MLDDNSRVILTAIPDVEGSDYINASIIDVSYLIRVHKQVRIEHSVIAYTCLVSCIGLQQGRLLHSSTRSQGQHRGRLLAHDLGEETLQHCHAHQVCGDRQGTWTTN